MSDQPMRLVLGEPSWSLHRALPDLGERTAAQFQELHRAPTAERAERLAIELEGCRQHVLRYRQALILEGEGTP
ncbi:MAG: hypothetical protein DI597_14445 [Pseudoxanthomonas spadix]|nr:MAG: hypothetical protein DI597_14445 [Pseudoxanthomonas spadix]